MRWTAAAMMALAACMAAGNAGAQVRQVTICLVRDGELIQEVHSVDPARLDTSWNHRQPPLPPGYAADQEWFINNEPFRFNDRGFGKYGLPRILRFGTLKRVGFHQGVPVFAPLDGDDDPLVLYLPVRPGCEFQPYQTEPVGRGPG
jgi:hypothetical protein